MMAHWHLYIDSGTKQGRKGVTRMFVCDRFSARQATFLGQSYQKGLQER